MSRNRRQRGLGGALRAFWTGPYWWLIPLVLLAGPPLLVWLLSSVSDGGSVPFVYNSF
jgi:hypothetical protein